MFIDRCKLRVTKVHLNLLRWWWVTRMWGFRILHRTLNLALRAMTLKSRGACLKPHACVTRFKLVEYLISIWLSPTSWARLGSFG